MRTAQRERDKEMMSLRHDNVLLTTKAQKATMDHMEAMTEITQNSELIANIYSKMMNLQKENEQLKSKAQKASMDHMDAIKSIQSEYNRLRTENNELNEECKETKLELTRVKKELLRKGTIDR
eukprot:86520_1